MAGGVSPAFFAVKECVALKISDMSFKHGCDVMQRIAAPCANLCADQKLKDDVANNETLSRLLVYCLQKHNVDSYEIASALMDKTRAEIDAMKFEDVYNELVASYDGVLAGFFPCSPVQTKSAGPESSP